MTTKTKKTAKTTKASTTKAKKPVATKTTPQAKTTNATAKAKAVCFTSIDRRSQIEVRASWTGAIHVVHRIGLRPG